jgi:hypothetical protein
MITRMDTRSIPCAPCAGSPTLSDHLEDTTLRRAFSWVQRPRRDLLGIRLGIRPRVSGTLYLTTQNREGEPEQVPGIIYN